MSKPTTKPTTGGLLKKLKNKTASDTRPPGWRTVEELLVTDPMSKTTARKLINQAVKDGIVEMKKMVSPTKKGVFAIRYNYKEKES